MSVSGGWSRSSAQRSRSTSMASLTYLTDGSPILAGIMSYRADAYRFQADLFRRA
jgi:DNA-binding GntR family transcriptional regulator